MITWLRVEGVALFLAATALYWHTSGAWWVFVVLLLAPDITALGYLGGPRLGALTYNLGHTTVGPVALFTGALLFAWPALTMQLALIWLAHIGIDRALAYGLKLPTGFKQTHLSPAAGK
jgi:hypothetical protein